MEQWFVKRKGGDFEKIAKDFQISPILAKLIRNRDIIGQEDINMYLHGTLDILHDGILMKDMEKACEILMDKIEEGSRIRVIGDYDIDGINATYILEEGLKGLKANVDTDIPDRMKDGYGLNKELINRALEQGVDTIITCDNGIAAKEEIAYGKKMGLTIIITDHHEVPFEEQNGERVYLLPLADAIVNPKREDCSYPFPNLCGAAVAYKLVEVLYNMCGEDVEDVDYLMEEVAIATVGDVMDLVGENRIFVKQGLEMIKRTSNLGLKALLECTEVPLEHLSAYHIGFVIGPCINASGRLDTAKRALELLNASSKKEATMLAGDLKALNDSRKEMTVKGVKLATEQVERGMFLVDRVLVIYLPECHESLAGIIAGRIRERYYKPVFVLTDGEEGIKGSGRSIEGYDMFVETSKCKSILKKFGGHKLAAGLSMDKEQVEPFRKKINEMCTLTKEDLIEKVSIDMQLPFGYLSEELVKELSLLEPFGKGNQKPIFVEKNVRILSMQVIGKNKNVWKASLQDSKESIVDAIYFGDVVTLIDYMKMKFGEQNVTDLLEGKKVENLMAFTYYPSINEYRGQKTLQIVVQNYR